MKVYVFEKKNKLQLPQLSVGGTRRRSQGEGGSFGFSESWRQITAHGMEAPRSRKAEFQRGGTTQK